MKKIIISASIVLVAILITILLFYIPNHRLIIINLSRIDKILLTEGNTLKFTYLSYNDEDFQSVIDLLDNSSCSRIDNFSQVGWSYRIQFLDSSCSTIEDLTFISNSKCQINNNKYEISSQEGEAICLLIQKLISTNSN